MSRFVNEIAAKAFSANSAAILLFNKFDEKEKFTAYLNRFNIYTDLKKVTVDSEKAQLFCSSIGSKYYNNLAAFLSPSKPINALKFGDLTAAFKQMLTP